MPLWQGKPTGAEAEGIADYAALTAKDYLAGAEVLEDADQPGDDDGWESASENEDSDGEWVDVHHSSDEDIQVILEARKLSANRNFSGWAVSH